MWKQLFQIVKFIWPETYAKMLYKHEALIPLILEYYQVWNNSFHMKLFRNIFKNSFQPETRRENFLLYTNLPLKISDEPISHFILNIRSRRKIIVRKKSTLFSASPPFCLNKKPRISIWKEIRFKWVYPKIPTPIIPTAKIPTTKIPTPITELDKLFQSC